MGRHTENDAAEVLAGRKSRAALRHVRVRNNRISPKHKKLIEEGAGHDKGTIEFPSPNPLFSPRPSDVILVPNMPSESTQLPLRLLEGAGIACLIASRLFPAA